MVPQAFSNTIHQCSHRKALYRFKRSLTTQPYVTVLFCRIDNPLRELLESFHSVYRIQLSYAATIPTVLFADDLHFFPKKQPLLPAYIKSQKRIIRAPTHCYTLANVWQFLRVLKIFASHLTKYNYIQKNKLHYFSVCLLTRNSPRQIVWNVITRQIKSVFNQNMSRHKDIQCDDVSRWNQGNCSLWSIRKRKGGWSLTPVPKTMEDLRHGLVGKYFAACDRDQARQHGWITLAQQAAQQAQNCCVERPEDIMFWASSTTFHTQLNSIN